MPPKNNHRLSAESIMKAKRKDAARKQARSDVRTIDRGIRGLFFPPRLASRPRCRRFRSLWPREKEKLKRRPQRLRRRCPAVAHVVYFADGRR